jgi:hypothetical protein
MYIHPSTHPYSYLENATSASVIEEAAKKALQVVLRLEKEADIEKTGSRAIATTTIVVVLVHWIGREVGTDHAEKLYGQKLVE